MKILKALRKAIKQEFRYEDELRGKLLNVIDLAEEEANKSETKKSHRSDYIPLDTQTTAERRARRREFNLGTDTLDIGG